MLCRLGGFSVADPHQVDADPDSTYHPDAAPDTDPSLKAQTLEKGLN
jgi:hypothetical protein